MGKMKDIGLLDCEDRPSIEENFKRVQGGGGKIKPEQLPDGYPYEEIVEKTVEHIPDDQNYSYGMTLYDMPPFAVGDTVKLKVDGVEYTLVASQDGGSPAIGDSYDDIEAGTGEYGWLVYCDVDEKEAVFYSYKPHTVGYYALNVNVIADKFLPNIGKVIELYIDPDSGSSKVFATIDDAWENRPMKTGEFQEIIPCDARMNPIPYTVVLRRTSYGTIMHTVVMVDEYSGSNLSEFHILDVANEGIPTTYTTASDYGDSPE